MDCKTLFTLRKSAVEGGDSNDAGMIVILMMALVFVPIVIAHLAVMLPDGPATQLAGMFSALLNVF